MATRNIAPRANAEGGIGTSVKKWLEGWFGTVNATTVNVTGDANITGGVSTGSIKSDLVPDTDNTRTVGSDVKNVKDVKTKQITLGGIARTTWPSAVAGSNGQVFQTGSITLNGQDGVTVTHNRGVTAYLVKTLPREITANGMVGDIYYVKSANTVVIYNSGIANLSADIEISAIV